MATTPYGVPIPPARITRREPGVGWVTRNIEMPLLSYTASMVPNRVLDAFEDMKARIRFDLYRELYGYGWAGD